MLAGAGAGANTLPVEHLQALREYRARYGIRP
jgi:hypothetical protein